MRSQEYLDKLYMGVAVMYSGMSYDEEPVGCVIVKDDQIIAQGCNSTTSHPQITRDSDGKTRPEVLHAEMAALVRAARSTLSTEGATLYVTTSPCMYCAVHIEAA